MMNKDGNLREYSGILTGILCDKTVNHEVSGDLTLPEHQPELRRLLSVSERILPPAKYISGSGVECNGNIDYTILYVGTDGGLYSADMSTEYELDVPIEQNADALSDGTAVIVNTVSEGISAKMTSPRRVNIKNRLRSHVRAYGDINTQRGDMGDGELERLYKTADNASVCPLSSEPIEISDEIGGLFEDSRVISATASVSISDMRRSSEGLDVSGDVTLKLLACRDGGRAETVQKKLPFSGIAESSEPVGDALCSVYGSVTDIVINVEEGRAVCNVTLVLSGTCAKNKQTRYIADIYSVERECRPVWENVSFPVAAVCANGNFSQSERLSAAEMGVPEGVTVIDVLGSAALDGCEYTGGKYVFSGQCKYSLLCEKDGDYSVALVELPIRYEIDGAPAEKLCFDALCDVIVCRGRLDGDTLCIDSEIAAYASVFDSREVSLVGEVRFGEPYGKKRSRMVVYYPAPGETPWDTAKKYHVPAASLAEEKNYYLF